MKTARLRPTFLIEIILGVVVFFPAVYSLLSNVVIQNSGQVSVKQVTAKSGSPADIQSAIDIVYAAGGGTVIIPAGVWTFNPGDGSQYTCAVNSYPGVSLVGAVENQTILRETVEATASMIGVGQPASIPEPQATGLTEIKNLWFDGCVPYHATGDGATAGNGGLIINSIEDFRVSHCIFTNFTNIGLWVSSASGGTRREVARGVIDHCTFDNPYKTLVYNDTQSLTLNGYGCMVGATDADAVEDSTFGGSNAYGNYGGHEHCFGNSPTSLQAPGVSPYDYGGGIVYIENCYFRRCRHSIVCQMTGVGFYVARYNYFCESEWYGYLDIHEGGWGMEAYGNVINSTYTASEIAGMGGTTQNSQAEAFELRGGYALVHDNIVMNVPYPVTFTDVSVYSPRINDTYIWSNTCTGYWNFIRPYSYPDIVENRTYFLYGPKSGYQPYPYPHPLISGTQLPPAWDMISHSSNSPSSQSVLSVYWQPMNNPFFQLTNRLSYYYLESNQTGSLQNSTMTAFTNGVPQWTNFTITLPSSGTVEWRVRANNTAGQWSTFCWQYITVT